MEEHRCSKISIWGLGVAIGIVWAISCFVAGITAIFGWGNTLVEVIGSFYIGYEPTFGGAILGAIWGFVDGFIGGALIAFFYDLVTRNMWCKK